MRQYTDQSQYGEYAGSQQTYEYEQQHSSKQHEYQPLFSQQPEVQPAPPLDYASFAGILCYSLCWFTGLLFLIFERQNRYVRFHALQSLIFFGAINILDIALLGTVVHRVFFLSRFAILIFLFVNLCAFVCWIIAMIHASRGTYFKLPFVGWLVSNFVNRGATLK